VTLGPDDLRHIQRDVAAAAANVEDPVSAPEPRVLEKPQGCLAHDVGEKVEPPLAVLAAGDRV